MRLLAWLLHGSLSHFVHCQNPHVNCHPVKFEENTHIADYVLIILFSFAEQLKVCFKSLSLKSLMYFRVFSSDCNSVILGCIVRDWFCVLKVRFTACCGCSCCVLFLSDSWTRYLALSFIISKSINCYGWIVWETLQKERVQPPMDQLPIKLNSDGWGCNKGFFNPASRHPFCLNPTIPCSSQNVHHDPAW